MSSASITAAEAAASHRAHAAYCRDKAQKRAAEGRHDVARQWRLEAQEAEAKAREVGLAVEEAASQFLYGVAELFADALADAKGD
jgi:hypothetical protein